MKKKIFILLLLFVIFPIKANAISIQSNRININFKNIEVCNNSTCSIEYFPLFKITDDYDYYSKDYVFMLNPSKFDELYNIRKSNFVSNSISSINISHYNDYDDIRQTNMSTLITKVIEHGNISYAGSELSDAYAVAKQIIILEILEGKRINFDENNLVLSNQNTYYQKISNSKNASLFNKNVYDAYNSIIKSITTDELSSIDYTEKNPLYLYKKYENGRYVYTNSISYDNLNNYHIIRNDSTLNVYSSNNNFVVTTSLFTSEPRYFMIENVLGTANSSYKKIYIFYTSGDYGKFILGKKYTEETKRIFVKTINELQIRSVNNSNNLITGAKYMIMNSDNQAVNFTKINNNYRYLKTGEVNQLDSGSQILVYGLPNGTYTLKIVTIPNGYNKESSDDIKFTVKDDIITSTNQNSNNNIINVSFKPATTIIIISALPSPDLPQKITYTLKDENDNAVKVSYDNITNSYKYDSNGSTLIEADDENKIFFTNLSPGTYKLVNNLDGSEKNINVSENNFNVISSSNSGELIFYNLNEGGYNLTGGKFKIQKYNSSIGSYVEAGITKVNDEEYKLDLNSKTSEFTMTGSSVKFTNIESSTKYRIIELTPPDGYEITNVKESQIDIEIDDQGYPTSTAMIVNKSIIVGTQASDNAELILGINTGQKIIKYGLIIGIIFVLIILLLIFRKKIIKKG